MHNKKGEVIFFIFCIVFCSLLSALTMFILTGFTFGLVSFSEDKIKKNTLLGIVISICLFSSYYLGIFVGIGLSILNVIEFFVIVRELNSTPTVDLV